MKNGVAAISLMLLTFLTFFSAYAEAPQEASVGVVKGINCKEGEVKITSYSGEEQVFHLGKAVEYKGVKSCEEIKEGHNVIIRYSSEDGKKIVSSVKARMPRQPREAKK